MSGFSQWLQQLNFGNTAELLITALAAMFCITVHEVSHGYAAYRLGDPTAKSMGRLTLNPIKHMDIAGLISMAILGFGWAKPVPVNFGNLKHYRRDTIIITLAGPVSNILLTIVFLTAYYALLTLYVLTDLPEWIQYVLLFFGYGYQLNAALAMFNLLPIPPLDGSKVILAFLPEKWYWWLLRHERYGFLALALLLILGVLDGPLSFLRGGLLSLIDPICRWPIALISSLIG